jgi:hypothetical protein
VAVTASFRVLYIFVIIGIRLTNHTADNVGFRRLVLGRPWVKKAISNYTISLAYAEQDPAHVSEMVLFSVAASTV